MRSFDTVNLQLGLLNIPLSVVSIIDYKGVGFRNLCPTCENPINEKKWCMTCNNEVQYEDLVKGLEVGKDKFAKVPKNIYESLDLTSRIVGVIPTNTEREEIQEKCYLLKPHRENPKPYFILREILNRQNISLIVLYSLRKSLNLGVIKPKDVLVGDNVVNFLMLKGIVYNEQIKRDNIDDVGSMKVSEDEVSIATELLKVVLDKMGKISYTDIRDERAKLLEKLVSGEIKPTEIVVKQTSDIAELMKKSIEMLKPKEEKKEDDESNRDGKEKPKKPIKTE